VQFTGAVEAASRSQGATADKCLIYDAANMKSRGAYVAMTRHKNDVQVFVNSEMIRVKHAAKPADRVIMAGWSGAQGFADEEEEIPNSADLSAEDMIKILASTWSAPEVKRNAMAYTTTPATTELEPDEADQGEDEADKDDDRPKQARPMPPMARSSPSERPRP
jgi:hypothetical protein